MKNERAKERIKELVIDDASKLRKEVMDANAMAAERDKLAVDLANLNRELSKKKVNIDRDVDALVELMSEIDMTFNSSTVITHFASLLKYPLHDTEVTQQLFNMFKESLNKRVRRMDRDEE